MCESGQADCQGFAAGMDMRRVVAGIVASAISRVRRSEAAAAGDATRAALGSALGRWAEAGGVGSSRDAVDEDEGAAAPSWTAGMWQDDRRGPDC